MTWGRRQKKGDDSPAGLTHTHIILLGWRSNIAKESYIIYYQLMINVEVVLFLLIIALKLEFAIKCVQNLEMFKLLLLPPPYISIYMSNELNIHLCMCLNYE